MYRSLVFPHLARAGRAWFEEYGFLLDRMEWREIGGWQYIGLRPLGGEPPPPSWLLPVLVRLLPSLRARMRTCVQAIRSDLPSRNLERWRVEWRPGLRQRVDSLRRAPLDELGDPELDRHLASVSELIGDALLVHFTLHGAVFLLLADLAFTCREVLGWGDHETFELVSGLSETSTAPTLALAALAMEARKHPSLVALFEQSEKVTPERLREADASFGAAFDAYQERYGFRALRYEVADPNFDEVPELSIGLLADRMRRGLDPDGARRALRAEAGARVEQARAALAKEEPSRLERFERALGRGRAAYPVREDNELFTISLPLGVARTVLLELGRRLAQRGQIEEEDDVFFLELDEARHALVSGEARDASVRRRKRERAWVEAHPGPSAYGWGADPPSFRGLPREARFAMQALEWAVERTFETRRSSIHQPVRAVVEGLAASPGCYTGTARVVMDETQLGRVRGGDVLVCPTTSPVWSVLFGSIGALVTDSGGLLSHPAIIAREHRIPAVVATGNASRIVRDGERVTVDGSRGRVERV